MAAVVLGGEICNTGTPPVSFLSLHGSNGSLLLTMLLLVFLPLAGVGSLPEDHLEGVGGNLRSI